MSGYEVLLANVGNPDHGQNPEMPLFGTRSNFWVAVDDLEEASRACSAYIAANDLGSGNWSGGQVRDVANDEIVADISYNGRINLPEQTAPAPSR